MDKWITNGVIVAIIVFLGKLFFWDSAKRKQIYEWSNSQFVKKEVCDERFPRLCSDVQEIKNDIKKLLSRNGIQ